MIRPLIRADRDGVAAHVVGAIVQQPAHPETVHLSEGLVFRGRVLTRGGDQAAFDAIVFLRRNPTKPRTPRPRSIIPHVEGKGVALIRKVPSATQLEQTDAKPKLPHKYPEPLVAENQASEVPTPKVAPVGAKILAKKLLLLVPSNKIPALLSIGNTLSELKPAV